MSLIFSMFFVNVDVEIEKEKEKNFKMKNLKF